MSKQVVIVGAGAVGVATALELAGRGASVLVLERGPDVAAGCSAGNGGIVGTSHVVPLAGPEALRDGLRFLLRRDSPFSLPPSPGALPWIVRFLLASRPAHHRADTTVLQRLGHESAELHRRLAERFETGFARRGLLGIFEHASALAAAAAHLGRDARVLDAAAARELAPRVAVQPAGAVLYEDERHCDPERFVRSLAAAAVAQGVQLRTGVEVFELERRGRRAHALRTTAGEIAADEIVVAAGAWSPALVRSLPITLPVRGGKGYHVDYARADDDAPMPVYFQERRILTTPLDGALRVTGMLQLVGTDLAVSRRRVAALRAHAAHVLAGLDERRVLRVWRGLRPCSPDGLPIVGRVPRVDNVTLATGHGMWGLQLAPITARLVADVLVGTPDDELLWPLRPQRFDALAPLRRR